MLFCHGPTEWLLWEIVWCGDSVWPRIRAKPGHEMRHRRKGHGEPCRPPSRGGHWFLGQPMSAPFFKVMFIRFYKANVKRKPETSRSSNPEWDTPRVLSWMIGWDSLAQIWAPHFGCHRPNRVGYDSASICPWISVGFPWSSGKGCFRRGSVSLWPLLWEEDLGEVVCKLRIGGALNGRWFSKTTRNLETWADATLKLLPPCLQ